MYVNSVYARTPQSAAAFRGAGVESGVEMASEILGHVVAAKVATGELGARLGLSKAELAVVTKLLAAGAYGWRAFECETLDADGTYAGTVRLTTHPAVTPAGAKSGALVASDPRDEGAVPDAALRRARPKRTPAQSRVRAALGQPAPSDPESQNGDPERQESSPAERDSDAKQ